MPNRTLTTSDATAGLQSSLEQWRAGRDSLHVLEAGCGSTSRVHLGPRARVTGLDISPVQLARNDALQEQILGDLQFYPIPNAAFDAAVCWDVLEHLDDPTAAVRNMAQALRPGGVLVLAVPNLWSLKGVITKLTPFWLHVAFYRFALGDRRVGTAASDQFPTRLRRDVAPARLRLTGRNLGLRLRYEALYEGPVQAELRRRSRLANAIFSLIHVASALATGSRFDPTRTDYLLVLERPPETDPASRTA
jgi:SAM-dependent methyltransferase